MKKRIVVSMTSWKKRIQFVSKTIFMMTKQTVLPDEIILNLSTDEFQNKEKDLPADLLVLVDSGLCRLNWVKENTKAFKKVIPILKEKRNESCWVISVDDDHFYKPGFLEHLVSVAEAHEMHYISPGIFGKQPHGFCMIYDPTWFNTDLLWSIDKKDMDDIITSDEWIYANLIKNGIKTFVDRELRKFLFDLNRPNKLCELYGNMNQCKLRRERIHELSGVKLTEDLFRRR